jgi:hypothetical protein
MRVWAIALTLAFCLFQQAWAQQMLSTREFVDAAIAHIQQSHPQARFERRDELGLFVQNAVLPEATLNLHTAYDEYRANPSALTEILSRWTRIATLPPEDIEHPERLIVVLRPRAMIEQFARESAAIRARNNRPPTELVWRPFVGDLVEVIIFDGEETQQIAMVETLAQLNLTPEAAWALAPNNLASRMGPVEPIGVNGAQHLVIIGGSLASSAMLDPRFCATRQGPTFIFLLINPEAYVIANRSEPAAMREFWAFRRQLIGDRATMSETPFACEEGRLQAVATD